MAIAWRISKRRIRRAAVVTCVRNVYVIPTVRRSVSSRSSSIKRVLHRDGAASATVQPNACDGSLTHGLDATFTVAKWAPGWRPPTAVTHSPRRTARALKSLPVVTVQHQHKKEISKSMRYPPTSCTRWLLGTPKWVTIASPRETACR